MMALKKEDRVSIHLLLGGLWFRVVRMLVLYFVRRA
jgi:hypothetical protein